MIDFTPGPWVESSTNIGEFLLERFRTIRAGKGDGQRSGCGFELTGFISPGDAKLIAAAPDILNALDDLVRAHELPGDHGEVEQALRAAVELLEELSE